MRVLFPLGSFYPDQSGGPNNTLYWHCKYLLLNGFDPVIVTTDRGIPIELRNNWLKTNYGTVIYTSNIFHIFPISLFYKTLKEMKNTDIIHLTSVFYLPSLIIYLLNICFFKKQVVWSVRGEFDKKALVYNAKIKSIYLFLVKRFSKRVTWHSTSDQESQYIRDIISKDTKIIQIPNYIEIPLKQKSISGSRDYFLYIGRIHPKKGIDMLIRGLKLSKYFKSSKFRLIIAGDDQGSHAQSLKDLCKTLQLDEKVKFIGQIVGEDKEILYHRAYFTIMPSHTENFGNVVVESLCQGTPVVASKGTPWECLVDSQSGFWEVNSSENLSLVVDNLINLDESTYEKYRKNAYSLVLNNFDIKTNIKKWLSFYEYLNNVNQ